jgi:ribosome-binding protein aMBF1 (putative translation factor)
MEEVRRSIDVLSNALGAARKVESALRALRDNWPEGIRRLTDLDNDVLYIRGLALDEVQREALRRALRRHGGNRRAVQKELRCPKSTLGLWIRRWGLQDESQNPRARGAERHSRPRGEGLAEAGASAQAARRPLKRVVADNLRAARERRGLSQGAVAERARLTVGYISMIERGVRTAPLETLDVLAKVLGVPALHLLHEGAVDEQAAAERAARVGS